MLRITTQTGPEAITFLVEGKLVGQWARELELAWKQAAAIEGHRARIVDLSETLFIDGEGRRILTNLFREGAFFRTACPMTESIIAEITGGSVTGQSATVWKGHRKLRGAVLTAVLLTLAGFAKGASPEPLRLTLRDAVQKALKQNPQVQIANLKTAVIQAARRENLEAFPERKVRGFPEHSGPDASEFFKSWYAK